MFQLSLKPSLSHDRHPDCVIVEDDRFFAAAIAAKLEKMDVGSVHFETVAEACRYLSKNTAAFAIIDIGLPDGSGLDIVKFIRNSARNSRMPVIIATANDDEMLTMKAYSDLGVMLISQKPVQWSTIQSVLETTVLS